MRPSATWLGPSPYARFDALRLVDLLPPRLPEIGASDIHLFAYLACLLGWYREAPPSEWGYPFRATELGAPFAEDLQRAVESLTQSLQIEALEGGALRTTELGLATIADLEDLPGFAARASLLGAASDTLLVLPAGDVRRAILKTDVEFVASRSLGTTRPLLELDAVAQLRVQFDVVRDAVGIESSILAPSVAWLSFLARDE